MDKQDKKPLTLEEAMDRLQQITEQMEQENLPLQQMMALYKEGTQLSQYCETVLDRAEKEILILEQKEEARDESEER